MSNPLSPLQGAVRLDNWGLIRARGADAVSFLHGQLTSDIVGLDLAHSRLAGFCSAKGRLLASFVTWKAADDEVLLACSADLLAPTLARLRMFVLRARCVLGDASAELPLVGLAGAAARSVLGSATPAAVGDRRSEGGVTVIRLADAAGVPRYLCVGGDVGALPALAPPAWDWLEVKSGVARIVRATVEQFVPQMLNYELVGGVDFRKGCYPGQEVVARSQYRGNIKRRSLLFEVDDAHAAPGMEVFHSDDPAQPAGMVVNAAAQPAGIGNGSLVLVEVKLAALAGGSLHLGGATGAGLRRIELPYALPLDAEAAAR